MNNTPGRKIKDILERLVPDWTKQQNLNVLEWPPDSFAVAAMILRESSVSMRAVCGEESVTPWSAFARELREDPIDSWQDWVQRMKDYGKQWRRMWQPELTQRLHGRVCEWWKFVVANGRMELSDLRKASEERDETTTAAAPDYCAPADPVPIAKKVVMALAQICAAADEASAGLGVSGLQTSKPGEDCPCHRGRCDRCGKRDKCTGCDRCPHCDSGGQGQSCTCGNADPAVVDANELAIVAQAMVCLSVKDQPATLCRKIRPDNAIVLPKIMTPQNGLTLRSLTHHLALLPNSEVVPCWFQAFQEPAPEKPEKRRGGDTIEPVNSHAAPTLFHDGINLLLFPWPMVMPPRQFKAVPRRKGDDLWRYDDSYGYFTYEPEELSKERIDDVARTCREAKSLVGRIDGVVFPEMALTTEWFRNIYRRLSDEEDVRFMISGVLQKAFVDPCAESTPPRPATNGAMMWVKVTLDMQSDQREEFPFEFVQHKHHRWLLEQRQIRRYSLGASLSPTKRWWEYCKIENRELNFVVLDDWLAMSVLICEDLARPDPVADLIRSVGPNLVIALLQDGPQLSSRWSARYATVLADDPGCSVLSLTGLGMATLSHPAHNQPPSRVVALWKQADGDCKEILLPDGSEALVLSLAKERRDQWTADGRKDNSSFVSLAGVHPVSTRKRRADG